MKITKILLMIFFMTCVSFSFLNTAGAAPADKPPELVVYYNSWPGDHENPLFKNFKMSPKNQVNLYALKDTASTVVATVNPGEYVTLITSDYHTYPSKSPVLVVNKPQYPNNTLKPGDIIYLMGYIGGGTCLAWYDNTVFNVPADGIRDGQFYPEQNMSAQTWGILQGIIPPKPELWLYVMTPDYKYGWLNYNSADWNSNN